MSARDGDPSLRYAMLQAVDVEAAPRPAEPAAEAEGRECRICRDTEAVGALIVPCQCTGSMAGVHKHCLQKWIESRPEQDMRCEVCGAPYNVRWEQRITCDGDHSCSCTACGHMAEGCILLFCLICMSGMMLLIKPELETVSTAELVLVGVLFVVTLIMSGFTLVKVFQRWRNAASARVIV